MNYWLMKSEPETFSIDHLMARPQQTEPWDGIRNYQVRNFIRDTMQIGDLAFFYHSNTVIPGVVGIVEIVSEAYADPTQFDGDSRYYDAKSTHEQPRWLLRDVRFVEKFPTVLSLGELKALPELHDSPLIRKGNRLSIFPISASEWQIICHLASDLGNDLL